MMRYHRVSPDCVPLCNGRKHNFRTIKEDDGDGLNEKIPNFSSFRSRSGATSSSSQEYKSPHLVHPDSPHSENHGNPKNQSQSFESSPNNGGDVLLKWGQKKRSRGSRTDNRVVTDESSSLQARQMIKIHKKVGPDKRLMMNNQTANMPPPCAVTSFSRGGNLRPINRNMEERSSLGNKSAVPRSTTEKRSSPSSPEKTEKVVSCSGTASAVEKPNGSLAQVDGVNDVESRGGEKVNMDLFEWPRIYISLSRKEKEDDFLAMKGTKLPQRPKKRAKNIDKTLQYCFPGMWLSDLTRGRYEVREKKCVKKQKRRGLKGMESMDSDSE